MMPLVSQGPTESLPITFPVSIHSTKVKPFFFRFLIQVFYIKINLVCELVPRYLPALILNVTIWIHPDNNSTNFSTIGFHLSHDLRLVVHCLTANLPTDGIDFRNFWHNFLKSCIDFSELLLPLLLVQLGTHSFFHVFFVTLAFRLQDLLLLLHLGLKSGFFFSNLRLHLFISSRLHLSLRCFQLSNMSHLFLLQTYHLLLE